MVIVRRTSPRRGATRLAAVLLCLLGLGTLLIARQWKGAMNVDVPRQVWQCLQCPRRCRQPAAAALSPSELFVTCASTHPCRPHSSKSPPTTSRTTATVGSLPKRAGQLRCGSLRPARPSGTSLRLLSCAARAHTAPGAPTTTLSQRCRLSQRAVVASCAAWTATRQVCGQQRPCSIARHPSAAHL